MPLEDVIRDLQKLDIIRNETARYLDEARAALATYLAADKATRAEVWTTADVGDEALVLKALCHETVNWASVQRVVTKLGSLQATDILGKGAASIFIGDGANQHHTLLDTARILSALAGSPNGVFAESFMVLYYAVIRELYSADEPDWVVGGARGATNGTATAYVTSNAVRGLSAFVRSLERTGVYMGVLAQIQEPDIVPVALGRWQEVDRLRRRLFLHTTLAKSSWNLAPPIDRPVPDAKDGNEDVRVSGFLGRIRRDIITALRRSHTRFKGALKEIDRFRASEEAMKDKRRVERSASAHLIARAAIDDAVALAQEARNVFDTAAAQAIADGIIDADASASRRFQVELEALKALFERAARRAKRLLRPAERYLSSVLDQNLARALSAGEHRLSFDAIELACAAASVGATTDGHDERLPRAAACLNALLSDDGLPKGRPFHHHHQTRTRYPPSQFQALLCYAHLLEAVPDDAFSVETVETLGRFFRKRRTPMPDKAQGSTFRETATTSRQRSVFDTAFAALALHRLTRLLDRRINQQILGYFPRRAAGDLQLKSLFYGDYGYGEVQDSVAIILERMCAHLANIAPPAPFSTPLFSAIFYGPPGTGKTTLVEALAASSDAHFVEVTPSDIVVRGADAIEERARAVFDALALLTNTVILFDEFEQVLKDRLGPDDGSRSIFHFLTPGMLPKLKKLNEAAKTRRLVYVLLTNELKTLDSAAIRPGRFDAKVGIYPPDVLSRAGRLWSEAVSYNASTKMDVLPAAFATAVRWSALMPMETLGKPGWFTRPRRNRDMEGTLFAFLAGKLTQPPHVDATVPLDPENPSSAASSDKDIWKDDADIQRIWAWDQAARSATTGTAAPLVNAPQWMAALAKQLSAWAAGAPLVKKS